MEGKIIIVGATGYTGSALAKLLKQENIDCHLIGRNESELQKLANKTGQPFSVCSNVSDEQSVSESLSSIANDKILEKMDKDKKKRIYSAADDFIKRNTN